VVSTCSVDRLAYAKVWLWSVTWACRLCMGGHLLTEPFACLIFQPRDYDLKVTLWQVLLYLIVCLWGLVCLPLPLATDEAEEEGGQAGGAQVGPQPPPLPSQIPLVQPLPQPLPLRGQGQVDVRDRQGRTPLWWACVRGRTDVARYDRCTNVHVYNTSGSCEF
jgi:ankyrin repeat protein